MPDSNVPDPQEAIKTPPPVGDDKKAEKYLDQLINLIHQDKIIVKNTDLSKFNLGSLKNHFWLQLKDYQVEVSHSKHPDTAQDTYVIIFNNLNQVGEGCEKIILAYMHLNQTQFTKFQMVAQTQIDRIKKAEEDKRLDQALAPIDNALSELKVDENDSENFSSRDDIAQNHNTLTGNPHFSTSLQA